MNKLFVLDLDILLVALDQSRELVTFLHDKKDALVLFRAYEDNKDELKRQFRRATILTDIKIRRYFKDEKFVTRDMTGGALIRISKKFARAEKYFVSQNYGDVIIAITHGYKGILIPKAGDGPAEINDAALWSRCMVFPSLINIKPHYIHLG